MTCAECRALLSSDDKKVAWNVESKFPLCACESFSIGEGSPGVVANNEIVYRLITSPADIDERTDEVLQTAFEKAYENGLSIFRERANDNEVSALVTDLLTIKNGRPKRSIIGLFRVECALIRGLMHGEPIARSFCVYDQTVPRKNDNDLPHVPTHATVFQRVPAPKSPGRNAMMIATNLKLFIALKDTRVPVDSFRNGLIASLNARSLAGEFELPGQVA